MSAVKGPTVTGKVVGITVGSHKALRYTPILSGGSVGAEWELDGECSRCSTLTLTGVIQTLLCHCSIVCACI